MFARRPKRASIDDSIQPSSAGRHYLPRHACSPSARLSFARKPCWWSRASCAGTCWLWALPTVGEDIEIHAVAAVDTTSQCHRCARFSPFQGDRVVGNQQPATARAGFARRSRYLTALVTLPVCCLTGSIEQNHRTVPIGWKDRAIVSRTFVKHCGQLILFPRGFPL